MTAALDVHKLSHEKEVQIPAKEDGKGFKAHWQWRTCPAQQISSQFLKKCTIGVTSDMLHLIVTLDQTENPQAMLENPPLTPIA